MPSKGARLPGELLELILQHLCLDVERQDVSDKDDSSFDPRVAPCSRVCRYWAAQIRQALFSTVALTSHEEAITFASLARSSAAVPAPLRSVVQTVQLYMNVVMPQSGPEPRLEPRTAEPDLRFGLGSGPVHQGSPVVRFQVHQRGYRFELVRT